MKILQHVLDDMDIMKVRHLCIASPEGQILINSQKIPIKIDLKPVVEEVASLFRNLERFPHAPSDIILTYTNEKVYVQKIFSNSSSEHFLLFIAVIPLNCLYFKRALKKNVKNIKFFLN